MAQRSTIDSMEFKIVNVWEKYKGEVKILVGNKDCSVCVKVPEAQDPQRGAFVKLTNISPLQSPRQENVNATIEIIPSSLITKVCVGCGVVCIDKRSKKLLVTRNINSDPFIWGVKYALHNFLMCKGEIAKIDFKNMKDWTVEEYNSLKNISEQNLTDKVLFGIKPKITVNSVVSMNLAKFKEHYKNTTKVEPQNEIPWSIPKGGFTVFKNLDPESSTQCALRELSEETDLTLQNLHDVVVEVETETNIFTKYYIENQEFGDKVHDEEQVSKSKIEICKWIPLGEAGNCKIDAQLLKVLQDYE